MYEGETNRRRNTKILKAIVVVLGINLNKGYCSSLQRERKGEAQLGTEERISWSPCLGKEGDRVELSEELKYEDMTTGFGSRCNFSIPLQLSCLQTLLFDICLRTLDKYEHRIGSDLTVIKLISHSTVSNGKKSVIEHTDLEQLPSEQLSFEQSSSEQCPTEQLFSDPCPIEDEFFLLSINLYKLRIHKLELLYKCDGKTEIFVCKVWKNVFVDLVCLWANFMKKTMHTTEPTLCAVRTIVFEQSAHWNSSEQHEPTVIEQLEHTMVEETTNGVATLNPENASSSGTEKGNIRDEPKNDFEAYLTKLAGGNEMSPDLKKTLYLDFARRNAHMNHNRSRNLLYVCYHAICAFLCHIFFHHEYMNVLANRTDLCESQHAFMNHKKSLNRLYKYQIIIACSLYNMWLIYHPVTKDYICSMMKILIIGITSDKIKIISVFSNKKTLYSDLLLPSNGFYVLKSSLITANIIQNILLVKHDDDDIYLNQQAKLHFSKENKWQINSNLFDIYQLHMDFHDLLCSAVWHFCRTRKIQPKGLERNKGEKKTIRISGGEERELESEQVLVIMMRHGRSNVRTSKFGQHNVVFGI